MLGGLRKDKSGKGKDKSGKDVSICLFLLFIIK